MEKFICVHGHFYQPPRENPWLEAITHQESAHPYHDWNERITAECYGPNSKARILDDRNRIVEITNNYSWISFNFGPTLLSWMEVAAPEVYQSILEADRESQKSFSGHGSALAQCYSHMIMPLANHRDKCTQVHWGIRDFEHRFKRKPEGMWLPETAVDMGTLEIMAEAGIRFTLLEPHQARRVRPLASGEWHEIGGAGIDATQPYCLRLPSGADINIFFYHGGLSKSVAFDSLLNQGKEFAQSLLNAFPKDERRAGLVHVATDGETYGHHHKFGDMALAYALKYIRSQKDVRLTNYGEFLERFPAAQEVEIVENTSWSCAHGVERWRSDCGCSTGGGAGWNQKWRAPLREALDSLRHEVIAPFREKGQSLLKDPWEARNDYIDVVLNRSAEQIDAFLERHALRALSDSERTTVLKLLELQRHAMLMYTSCGWFFSEVSGVETEQILQYAGRVTQLSELLFGKKTEARFFDLLSRAKSNLPEKQNARRIFEESITTAQVGLSKLCAHYAFGSLFEPSNSEADIYCFRVEVEDFQRCDHGKARMATGRVNITSRITLDSRIFHFSVMHFGDYNLKNFVHEFESPDAYERNVGDVKNAFSRGDFAGVLKCLESHFDNSGYPLKVLSRNEKKKIFDVILVHSLSENEPLYQKLYESCAPLNRYLREQGMEPPKVVASVMEAVSSFRLRQAFESDHLNFDLIEALLDEAKAQETVLDTELMGDFFRKNIEILGERVLSAPDDLSLLKDLQTAAKLVSSLSFQGSLWRAQNICYEMLKTVYPKFKEKKIQGDVSAGEWVARFEALAEALLVGIH